MRYFIVFFRKQIKSGSETAGVFSFPYETYPPYKYLIQDITGKDFAAVTITGVNEVTKEDFENWNKS